MKKMFVIFSILWLTTANATNKAWTPAGFESGVEYTEDETSSVNVIIKDSVLMFGMNLTTIENRIYAAFGNEIAKDSLDSQLRDISYIASREADVKTLTHILTTGTLWILIFTLPIILIWIIARGKKNNKKVMAVILILLLGACNSQVSEISKQDVYNKFVSAMYESCMENAKSKDFCQCQGRALVDLILAEWKKRGIKTREEMAQTLADDNFLEPLHNKSWDTCL